MDSKVTKYLLIANTVGLVIVLGLLFKPQVFNLGAASHFSGPVDSANGFTESGTTIIDAGGGLRIASSTVLSDNLSATGIRNSSGTTVGGGTVVTNETCASASVTLGAIAHGATSSVSAFTLSGATSSQTQVYSFGYANNATNTVGGLIGQAYPATTTGVVGINLYNAGSAAWGAGTNTFSVCYQQF